MKYYRLKIGIGFFTAVLFILLFSSCESELDKNPLDAYAEDSFWESEEKLELALTGIYRGNISVNAAEFNNTDWWSYNGLMFLEFASDNAYDRRGDNAATVKLSNGTLTSTNGYVDNYWNSSYIRISRANDFLSNVEKLSLDAGKLDRYIAEAKALRATQYFYLSQYWGDIPLITEPIDVEKANNVSQTKKEDVMSFVIDELVSASQNLPTQGELSSSEIGRLTKQAALAFLGRAFLGEKKYDEAAATYKEIIDLGENIIDPDYQSIFLEDNENSNEIIFSTQFIKDKSSNAMFQHFFPAIKGGWHMYNPLGDIVEAYEFKDGTPFSFSDKKYDPLNISGNRDPRLQYSVLFNGDSFGNVKYITHPDSTRSPDQLGAGKQTTQTGYGLKKFMNQEFSGDLTNSGSNLPIIRYSEILLSYLEAKIEAGDPISQSLLNETINEVRNRASVDMPPVEELDREKLREILRNERRVELAFEGIRYWDLLRWELAEEKLNGKFYGAPFPGAKKIGQGLDEHNRWFVTEKNFRSTVDYLWPIPQSEININKNLKQNPGY